MPIAARVKWFLDSHGAEYELVPHRHTPSSGASANAANVPPERVAKCVVLEDERGYVMAILAASARLDLGKINAVLHRELELASEPELGKLFEDCEVGAVPPFGAAYNVPTVVDDHLLRLPEVWFEAGDHADLIHMRGAIFLTLLQGARHGDFTARASG